MLPGVEFWGCAPARRQCQRFWGCGDCGAAVKVHPNLDFQRYRESPRPGEGLLFRKEAKARAVLGLAEPVHPLPHLPRQSRLFGRRFRLHPLCGGRSILFEYRAADWNPALALRMRARGSSKVRDDGDAGGKCGGLRGCGSASAGRRARMAGVMRRWFRRVWWRKAHACGSASAFGAAGIAAGHLTPSEFECPIISEIASSRRGTSF